MLFQDHRSHSICLYCLVGLLVLVLADCAGERPKPEPAPVGVAPPSAKRLREAISYYLGTNYKYGGASKDGVDCSGFVMKVYERAGMKVPRTSELQFESGEPIPKDALQYGDLVFFNKYCQSKYSHVKASIFSGWFSREAQPCHVGIYIGNGRFIHASASQGGVAISNLNQDAWKRSLIGVRRYLPDDS
ncbi:C40 family peptidase [Desulfobacca acetoxidans]